MHPSSHTILRRLIPENDGKLHSGSDQLDKIKDSLSKRDKTPLTIRKLGIDGTNNFLYFTNRVRKADHSCKDGDYSSVMRDWLLYNVAYIRLEIITISGLSVLIFCCFLDHKGGILIVLYLIWIPSFSQLFLYPQLTVPRYIWVAILDYIIWTWECNLLLLLKPGDSFGTKNNAVISESLWINQIR